MLFIQQHGTSCMSYKCYFLVFYPSQKIFVMPNMDDVWLPIMHSAMDTRSSVNLATVTTDALKDVAPLDLEQTTDDF